MPVKKINLKGHFIEKSAFVDQQKKKGSRHLKNLKKAMKNQFIGSNLMDILEADCSIYPRVLPASYLPIIKQTAYNITNAVMKLITLPEEEVKAIFPHGPIRDYLINELKVLKYRPDRLIGSLRFDMVIVGPPSASNPPKLLEINEIGFDGLSRSSFIQETLGKLYPSLREKYFSLDSTLAELSNMRRLGSSLARFQLDEYNWDEELLWRRAQDADFDLRLISPSQLKYSIDRKKMYLMAKEPVKIHPRKLIIGDWRPSSYMVSYALETSDFKRAHDFYTQLIRQRVPQYSPFLTGLFASKAILTILADPMIQKLVLKSGRAFENCILPASMLSDAGALALENPNQFVIKHVDGFGGEQVFMGKELIRTIKNTPPRKMNEWILQERVKINTIEINGFLSHPKNTISDLGIFCQYDWSRGKFNHFEVGGFLSRATNTSWKVNVSSGGAQVGVYFSKKD